MLDPNPTPSTNPNPNQVPPGGLAGETDLKLAHAIHLNELEQLPPNVHLSGGVGMLFRSGLGSGLGLGLGLG